MPTTLSDAEDSKGHGDKGADGFRQVRTFSPACPTLLVFEYRFVFVFFSLSGCKIEKIVHRSDFRDGTIVSSKDAGAETKIMTLPRVVCFRQLCEKIVIIFAKLSILLLQDACDSSDPIIAKEPDLHCRSGYNTDCPPVLRCHQIF